MSTLTSIVRNTLVGLGTAILALSAGSCGYQTPVDSRPTQIYGGAEYESQFDKKRTDDYSDEGIVVTLYQHEDDDEHGTYTRYSVFVTENNVDIFGRNFYFRIQPSGWYHLGAELDVPSEVTVKRGFFDRYRATSEIFRYEKGTVVKENLWLEYVETWEKKPGE